MPQEKEKKKNRTKLRREEVGDSTWHTGYLHELGCHSDLRSPNQGTGLRKSGVAAGMGASCTESGDRIEPARGAERFAGLLSFPLGEGWELEGVGERGCGV